MQSECVGQHRLVFFIPDVQWWGSFLMCLFAFANAMWGRGTRDGWSKKRSCEQIIWYKLEPQKIGKPSDKEQGWRDVDKYGGKWIPGQREVEDGKNTGGRKGGLRVWSRVVWLGLMVFDFHRNYHSNGSTHSRSYIHITFWEWVDGNEQSYQYLNFAGKRVLKHSIHCKEEIRTPGRNRSAVPRVLSVLLCPLFVFLNA